MRQGADRRLSDKARNVGESAGDAEEEAEDHVERASAGEVGWALPLLGAALLVSPAIRIVSGDATVFGAPAAFVYIFAAWGLLILLAGRLARRAARAERAERRER